MDQAGPSGSSDIGGTISFDGTALTRSGFVGHRRMVEREHPLEQDLLSLGLDLLPECLQRWLRAKVHWVNSGNRGRKLQIWGPSDSWKDLNQQKSNQTTPGKGRRHS